jgi:ribosomal protein S18 acetylase RimI-like enzyme
VTVTLVPITREAFERRRDTLVDGFADDLRRARAFSPEGAREESARQLADLLPDGPDTDGMLLFAAEVDGQPVGWIWLGLPVVPDRPHTAWIYDLEVDLGHRGQGYGRAIVRAAERELVRHGVSRLGLNVFGYHTAAIRLYESLGFEVTAQQMAKSLTP